MKKFAFSYFATESMAFITDRNVISETKFADILQKQWSFEVASLFPWLTFFFFLNIIISSRTFKTIANASQGWDYAQLPEK